MTTATPTHNPWLQTTIDTYLGHYPQTTTPHIWEVGSRDGHDACHLAQSIGTHNATPRVTCVEAIPAQVEVIHRLYPGFTVHTLAASDTTGTAPFVVYEGDEGAVGSSSLALDWKAHDHLPSHQITVKTDTLDNLVAPHEEIDIMKIDVEGHSLQVLGGFATRLRQVRVFHIETETWTGSTSRVKALMAAHGYRLTDEHEQYLHMPDLVFVRETPHI